MHTCPQQGRGPARVASFATLPSDLGGVWNRLPRGQKVVLLLMGGGAIVLFMLMTSWARSPDFVPLYGGLEPADAGAVVDRLQTQGIPYQVSDGGTSVRVPSSRVAEARIDLASVGLPSGGAVGFEIFDNQSFGVTDFVQRINLRRSLEGELSRTINQLDGVRGSRVHIAIPENQLFTELEAKAGASVVLELRPGSGLSQAQVRGVAHLVAQSVDGLDAANVTILNTKGDILYDGSDDLGVAGSTQLQLAQAYEDRLERDLRGFLRSVLGPHRSAVEVSAALDFTHTDTTTETFVPVEAGERSSQTVEETFTGTGGAEPLNVPGAVANVPGANVPEVDGESEGASSSYTRTESTVNNELNRILAVTTTAPGQVQQLSISVILDESVSEEQASELKAALSTAAGIDPSRGDALTVSRVPFDLTELEEAEAALAAEEASNQTTNMMRMALPVVAVLLAGGFFWFFIRKVGQAGQRSQSDQFTLAVGAGAATPALPQGETVEHLQERMRLEAQQKQRETTTQEITQFARAQPQAVAEVVQTWVREDK